MEIQLRDFREGDFETLWSIDQRCFAPGISYSRRELAAYQRFRGSFTLVAEESEAIAGFLIACVPRNGLGHIITIDVLPTARRSGVGSHLLAGAEARLQSAKCKLVYLETAVDNGAAITFYKRHNYTLVKTVPRYYSNGVDALVLEKDLHSVAQAS